MDKENYLNSYKTISFDIFDTLVTRKTATQFGVFAYMQEALINNYKNTNSYLAYNFYDLRIQADAFARRIHCVPPIQDVTFDQIYNVFFDNLMISKKEIDFLKDLELQTEKKLIIPIKENIELLKKLYAQNKNVFCISNMYLSEKQIRTILSDIDPIFNKIKIYVSSEYAKTKSTGDLFEFIKEDQKLSYEDWLHIGDNPAADVRAPRKLGISVKQYKYVPLERYEADILAKNTNSIFIQNSVGISKNLRLLEKLNSKQALGASLFAPILLPYVLWFLEEAQKRKINRLYFIARDGFILKKMADIIIAEKKLKIKTYYIYGSRIAWRIFNGDINLLSHFFEEYADMYILTPAILAQRLGISFSDFLPYLPKQYRNVNKKLRKKDLDKLKLILLNNENFINFLNSFYKDKKARLISYLKQEIDFKDENFAFIEYRGSGRTMDFLASITKEFYAPKIKTFYFQLLVNSYNENSIKYSMFLSRYDNEALEIFTRASHGCTIDYKKVGKEYREVLDEEGSDLKNYHYNDVIEGVVKFTEKYVKSDYFINDLPNILYLYIKYFLYYSHNLDKKTADLLGDIPYDRILSNDQKSVFAENITLKDILKALVSQKHTPNVIERMRIKRSKKLYIWLYKKAKSFRIKTILSIHLNKKENIVKVVFLGKVFNFKKPIEGAKF